MLELLIALALVAWVSRKMIPAADAGTTGDGTSTADYGIDAIANAVAWVESRGRQTDAAGNTITSSKGALGIMQLLPSTAAQLGVDPYDAQQNYQGGRNYLQQLFEKYQNWEDALAAYVWGPGNVDRAKMNGAEYPASVQGYISDVETYAGG